MSHADKKVKWCLMKGEKEKKENGKHRGLLNIKPDINLVNNHIAKAEHNLKAIVEFHKIGFSDWSASATFYAIYHSLLAILIKFGYESRNQECTFAMIYKLIEEEKISLDKELIEDIHIMNLDEAHEQPTVIELRESEQYGINLSLEENTYKRLLALAKKTLNQVKEIIIE